MRFKGNEMRSVQLVGGSHMPPKAYTPSLSVSRSPRGAKRGIPIVRQSQLHQNTPKRLQTALPATRGRGTDEVGHSKEKYWGSKTITLASGATAVFLVLLMPQIIRNARNIMSGDYSALSAIAWVVSALLLRNNPAIKCGSLAPQHKFATKR